MDDTSEIEFEDIADETLEYYREEYDRSWLSPVYMDCQVDSDSVRFPVTHEGQLGPVTSDPTGSVCEYDTVDVDVAPVRSRCTVPISPQFSTSSIRDQCEQMAHETVETLEALALEDAVERIDLQDVDADSVFEGLVDGLASVRSDHAGSASSYLVVCPKPLFDELWADEAFVDANSDALGSSVRTGSPIGEVLGMDVYIDRSGVLDQEVLLVQADAGISPSRNVAEVVTYAEDIGRQTIALRDDRGYILPETAPATRLDFGSDPVPTVGRRRRFAWR